MSIMVLVMALCPGLLASTAHSKESKESKASAQETGKQEDKKYGISKAVAEKLLAAYDLLEGDRYDEALEIVDDLGRRRRLKRPELAQLHRFRAYIFVSKDQNEKAIGEFEKSLALDAMEPAAEQVMIYSLAQIYTEREKNARSRVLVVGLHRELESARQCRRGQREIALRVGRDRPQLHTPRAGRQGSDPLGLGPFEVVGGEQTLAELTESSAELAPVETFATAGGYRAQGCGDTRSADAVAGSLRLSAEFTEVLAAVRVEARE